MMSLLTFLLPGLSQLSNGQVRKGATMFGCAAFFGIITGGVGWVGCGIWSVIDANAAKIASPGGSTPADSRAAAAPQGASTAGAVMPWVCKFSVLAAGVAVAFYSMNSGQALRSLSFLGLQMDFESSLSDLSASPANSGGGEFSSALRDEDVDDAPAPEPTDSRGEVSEAGAATLDGTWKNAEGAEYFITTAGDDVHIREMSKLFYFPIETATCSGTADARRVSVDCETYVGTSGALELTLASSGRVLTGSYLDATTGARVPMELRR